MKSLVPCGKCGEVEDSHNETTHEYLPMRACSYCMGAAVCAAVPASDLAVVQYVPCPSCHGFGTQ